jgi:hypothetical protein
VHKPQRTFFTTAFFSPISCFLSLSAIYSETKLNSQGIKESELEKRREKRQELQATADKQAQLAMATQVQGAKDAAAAEADAADAAEAAEAAGALGQAAAADEGEGEGSLSGLTQAFAHHATPGSPLASPPTGAARMVKELRKSSDEALSSLV